MTSAKPSSAIGKRYILHEQLGAGGMGAVYRATDRLASNEANRHVALKRVTTPADQLDFATRILHQDGATTELRLALANEFKTLASLRHPHIISVLDYGFDDLHQPYFTMDLLDRPKTIFQAGQDQSFLWKVDLLLAMLQALAYLHRRGVIHRDLKPGNVMVVGENSETTVGQVKVVDFGLSLVGAATTDELTDTTSGTLAYMAPELFRGKPSSKASDLYAVGVIAFELFAGRHPFDTTNLTNLLNDILTKPPDISLMGHNLEAAVVVERLLEKEAEARYAEVGEVVEALCQAVGRPLPVETVEIRESFLQAARFVERDAELLQLSKILNQAIEGQGRTCLVGGESGVGKSRLLDELRTLALVQGALVLRGQAISEGGSPYQLWREILRWLILTTELQLDELSVLKVLVPDVTDLSGREVPDAPPLDPLAMHSRLLAIVTTIFRQQKQPLAVLLEDLHWADSESLAVLERLGGIAAELPLFIIGSYRDDERADLPTALPGTQSLKLKRLSKAGISELSESMLGAAGQQAQLVELLQRETEGNVFFVVEVVRALAAEAGQLSQIGSMTLPEKVLAGGIQQIVQRRLERVPEEARSLLQIAAVAGRELDLEVIGAADSQVKLEQWLATCADAAVLDVQDNRWRFAHDKLREGILSRITDQARPDLHRRVAQAIETLYPDVPDQYASLAYHWGIVGDRNKEIHFATRAGELALRNGASVDAARQFSRALEVVLSLPDTPERIQRELPLQINLGVVLLATKGYTVPEVKQAWTRAHELSRQLGYPPQLFQVLWGLWSFYVVRSKLTEALELAQKMLDQANSTQERVQRIVGHWTIGVTLWGLGQHRTACTHLEQGVALYDHQEDRSLALSFGQDPGVTCLVFLGHAMWPLGYPERARQSFRDAVSLAREINHPFSLAFALSTEMAINARLQDTQALLDGAGPLIALSTEHNFPLWMAWATSLRGWALTRTGKRAEGIALLDQGLAIIRMIGAEIEVPHLRSLQARAYGEAGLTDQGLKIVDDALNALAQGDNEDRSAEPELHRIRGELLLQLEQPNAEECFQTAIATARRQDAKLWELRATVSLCRLWQKHGKISEARAALSAIYGWFTEGFETVDLKVAKALLDELV